MDRTESWMRPVRFVALLAVLIVAQFPDAILGISAFFFRDYGFFGYPLAAYHRDAFWNGEIPLWNSYNSGGLPFLAQWNTMVLYPGSLIYLLLPMPWSLGLFCAAHQFLAGLGMYFLARKTSGSNLAGAIAGFAFAFGGLLLSSLKWPNNIAAFGLMPWVVLTCLHHRSIGIAALVGALQMLTGAPEVIFLTWVLIGTLTVAEAIAQKRFQILLRLIAIVILISAVAAAQLLPFLQLLQESQRTVRFAGSEWSMPIWGWANFFVPLFGTFPSYHDVPAQPHQYWASTYYVPLGAFALALLAILRSWRERLMLALALVGMMLALGEAGRLYSGLKAALPSLGFMRFPIKFVVLPIFLLPWLAAHGIVVARERPKLLLGISGAFIAICAALIFIPPPFSSTQTFTALSLNALGRIICLSIFVIFLRNPKRFAILPILPLIVLWLDGRLHSPEQNPRAPTWVFDRGLPHLTNAPTLGHGRAMLDSLATYKLDHRLFENSTDDITATRLALFCNANLIDRIPKLDGFFSLYPRESGQLIDFMYAGTNRVFPGLEKLLAVSHKNVPGKTVDWEQLAPNPLWISGGQRAIFANPADTIQALLAPEFDSTRTIYLPPELEKSQASPANVAVDQLAWTPEKISFQATASTNAWLLIGQSYFPNWRATLNNSPATIQRANHGFQALLIPFGKTNIELTYDDQRFRAGAFISILGLAVTAVLIGFRK